MDTRQRILQENFESIRKIGFQGTRTDKVLLNLGITKGAFYHYFPDKLSLGYAIVEEILHPNYCEPWKALENSNKPAIESIIEVLTQMETQCSQENIQYGCPLNNLIQEMAPIDEGFRERLNRIVEEEHRLIQKTIAQGLEKGELPYSVRPDQLAWFIIASMEGCYTIGKIRNSKALFDLSLQQLIRFLKSLT